MTVDPLAEVARVIVVGTTGCEVCEGCDVEGCDVDGGMDDELEEMGVEEKLDD